MASSKDRVTKVLISLALAAAAIGLGASAQFYQEALTDAFFAVALASVLILHFRVRPSWADVVAVAGVTSLLAAFDFGILNYQPRFMAWFSFLGLGSFLLMAIRTVWASGEERKTLVFAWAPAMLFVLSEYFASTMLEWTAAAHPKSLDLYLFSFDASMHVPFSFAMGRLFAKWPALRTAALIFYIALPISITVVYAGQLLRSRKRAFPAMLAFLITGPLGILFYNIFPASGPHYVFRSFPADPIRWDLVPRLVLQGIAIKGPRNAMPSLHMAWTLLAWWYSRGLSWVERMVALAFLGFTVLATLGTGEHWFVDLVVAVPFALMIEALCAYPVAWKDARRWSALLVGGLGTLLWFVVLWFGKQFFWASPVVSWGLCAATVGIVYFCETKLWAAQPENKGAAARASVEVKGVRGNMVADRAI